MPEATATQPIAADAVPAQLRARLTPQGSAERSFLVERAAVNIDARTVSLAFASEIAVERYWGFEILECTATAMRSGRLRGGANLLCEHDRSDVVGVVESVEIGADRVARAVVRFGKSERAEEVFQDVVDGIRRNVSVGYMVHKAVLVETKEGADTYRITDWEPFEISIVSVPADTNCGVGRSHAEAVAPAQVSSIPEPTPQPKERAMSEIIAAAAAATIAAGAAAAAHVETPGQRNHALEITKIAAALPGGSDLAMRSIQAGHTVEQFQQEALRHMASKPLPTADIGLSAAEVKRFSLMRAINALANPTDRAAFDAAAFERECSEAVAKKMGKAARGLFLPHEIQKRDLLVGTASAGGNLVATDLLSGSFIDILRNAMVINRMGTRMLTGLVGQVAIPKQTGAATAYWVAENGSPTESQQALGQVTMSPKTVGAYTDISRRLTLQSSVDVESMVQQDLATVLGLAIQQAAINGTGASNQPSGLLTLITPGVIGGTNGAAPTWANMIALETAVAVANADVGTLGYLTNAKVRGKLKSTEKFGTTNGNAIWDTGNTPVNGYQAAVTNAVPSNLTKGTATSICSAILFGNFADLIIGMWGTLDLMVDPYTGSTAGTIRVVALQDVDVAVRNAESFATMVDALTT